MTFLVRMHEQQMQEALAVLGAHLEECGLTDKASNHRAKLMGCEVDEWRWNDLEDSTSPVYEALIVVQGYDWMIGADLNLKSKYEIRRTK
ncbi:hypothetical protein VPHD491S_0246 [Vibrio phage D491s]